MIDEAIRVGMPSTTGCSSLPVSSPARFQQNKLPLWGRYLILVARKEELTRGSKMRQTAWVLALDSDTA